MKGEAPDIHRAAALVARAAPDAILLLDIDYDHGAATLAAFRDRIAEAGHRMAHVFALRPNTGWQTGLDLDGDGRTGGPRDAQGYGRFSGQGGMAILSRWPVSAWQDHSRMLWRDLPGTSITRDDPGYEVQRLSTVGHWSVTLTASDGTDMTLLAFHATPPVFDGPEDRNGRRNHDEIMFWQAYLDGAFAAAPPEARYVILGDANLDPEDGDGLRSAIRALLSDPRIQDPEPRSDAARDAAMTEGGANADHGGDPALDTANWQDDPGPGNLRVDYVLPSADLAIDGAGVLWPEPISGGDDRPRLRHGLVWVDLVIEGPGN